MARRGFRGAYICTQKGDGVGKKGRKGTERSCACLPSGSTNEEIVFTYTVTLSGHARLISGSGQAKFTRYFCPCITTSYVANISRGKKPFTCRWNTTDTCTPRNCCYHSTIRGGAFFLCRFFSFSLSFFFLAKIGFCSPFLVQSF